LPKDVPLGSALTAALHPAGLDWTIHNVALHIAPREEILQDPTWQATRRYVVTDLVTFRAPDGQRMVRDRALQQAGGLVLPQPNSFAAGQNRDLQPEGAAPTGGGGVTQGTFGKRAARSAIHRRWPAFRSMPRSDRVPHLPSRFGALYLDGNTCPESPCPLQGTPDCRNGRSMGFFLPDFAVFTARPTTSG